MTPSRPERIATRLQIAGTAVTLCLGIAAIIWATAFSSAFPFLPDTGAAQWIGPADPITTSAVGVDRSNPRTIRFQHRFQVEDASAPLVVTVKALHGFQMRFNGKEAERRGINEWNWKQGARIDLGLPQVGDNYLEIDVVNVDGPPLLWLEGMPPHSDIATGEHWIQEEDLRGTSRARRANDTQRGAVGLTAPKLSQMLSQHWVSLSIIAILSAFFSLALRRLDAAQIAPWLAGAAWAAILLFWGGLFIFTISQLPVFHGYDGPDHLAYVRYIVERGALPLATDGPAMYHPPLFYLLSAGIWNLAGGPSTALHVLPFLSGLVQVAIAFGLAKLLFPAQRALAATAVLVAGLLPVNVVLASHFSNEPFHSALSACVILLTARLLISDTVSIRQCLVLGVVLGLTLLTKVTGLLLLPLVLGFLAAKVWLTETTSLRNTTTRSIALVIPLCLLAGGYYLRNWLQFGQAAIGNWDVPGNPIAWWMHPGFHTSNYFTQFGESLQRPFFAGYTSFADGIYATFWGDSLLSGVSSLAVRHPYWNYDWMIIVPILALPATALLVGGCVGLVARSFRGEDLRQRAALAFVTTTIAFYAFAVLFINIRLPFYAQAKASYALAALAPLAVAGAYAITAVRQHLDAPGRRIFLLLFDAWLGTLAIALVLSFGA